MRFARRTGWRREENALSVALAKARSSGEVLDLTASNPTTAGLEYAAAEILSAISRPEAMIYRPDPFGTIEAREAIAAHYARRSLTVSPERIVLTASTSEAYGFLLRLLCDPGDRVLVPAPSYPLFDFLLDLADVEAKRYRLAYDGAWHLDRSSVHFDERVRAVLAVSPNNPTGSCLDAEDRAVIARGGLPIVSDEVFGDYAIHGHAAASWIGSGAPVFALNGLSKIAGLPQLKLGWIVVDGPEAFVAEARSRLEIVADTYLSVSTPVQVALPRLLELAEPWQASLRSRLRENRTALEDLARSAPIRVRRSEGGWSAILDLPRVETDEAWAIRLLDEEHVLAHPGYFFELEGEAAIVVSLLPPPEVFREGISRIVRLTLRVTGGAWPI
jgi:alanine-synthesizing transaminase